MYKLRLLSAACLLGGMVGCSDTTPATAGGNKLTAADTKVSPTDSVPTVLASNGTVVLTLTGSNSFGGGMDVTTTATMPQNSIFDSLVKDGVLMPGGTSIKLPPPIMSETMTPGQQAAALALTASSAHVKLDDFLAENPFAPFYWKVKTPHKDPTFRTIDIAFVAHGEWKVLVSEEFGKKVLEEKKGGAKKEPGTEFVEKAGLLTEAEMASRKLVPKGEINHGNIARKEGWLYTTLNLFSQAQVSSSRHVVMTKGPTVALFAAQLDPRFDKDADYPNQWRSIDLAKPVDQRFGPVQLYQGSGFYVRAVKLTEPKDAIFFEYHSAYYEPEGWFNGENVLLSKLGYIAKLQIEKFRRKLAQ